MHTPQVRIKMPRLRGLKQFRPVVHNTTVIIVRIKMPRLRGLKPDVLNNFIGSNIGKNQNAPIEGIETRTTGATKRLRRIVRIKMPRLRGLKLYPYSIGLFVQASA